MFKKTSFKTAIAVVLAIGMGTAFGQDAGETDKSGRGAVLCNHWIMAQSFEVARACFPQRDQVMIDALGDSLGRYERFIARNSDMSEVQARKLTLDRRRQTHISGTDDRDIEAATCSTIPDTHKEFYAELFRLDDEDPSRAKAAQAIRDGASRSLSIDRKPLMNPCL